MTAWSTESQGPSTAVDQLAMPAAAAAVLVVTALLWFGGRPTGAGALLTGLGQLTGFGCSVFALATVLLMARIPGVDQRLGTDRALVWHRRAATLTIVLLVVHIVGTVLGYSAADGSGLGSEVSKLVGHYPDMLTATVGSALLLGVALTSIRAIRKWLRYETWLFAHWYIYPALFLVFGHELADGSSFVHASAATLVWTWAHVAVLLTLLWYRVALPAWRANAHPLQVTTVHREGNDAVTVLLRGVRLDRLRASAGQHLRLRFLVPGGWWQSHPYSLSAPPTDHGFRVTIVDEGDFSQQLMGVRAGTRVLVTGAHGKLTADRRLTDRVTLIGGGSGIAPLLAILQDLPPEVHTRVLYRATDRRSAVLRSELEAVAANRRARVHVVLGHRHDDAALDILAPGQLVGLLPGIAGDDVYVCGSAGFVDAVCASLSSLGVPAERQHTERFDA